MRSVLNTVAFITAQNTLSMPQHLVGLLLQPENNQSTTVALATTPSCQSEHKI